MKDEIFVKLRYAGRLQKPDEVRQLILETEDICRTQGWPYEVWDMDWSKPQDLRMSLEEGIMNMEGHAPLKGISFSIGETETIWLTFLPDGTLQSLLSLAEPDFLGQSNGLTWQRVKTGFDGAITHLTLCKLFRYLADKYFAVFEVMDESGYWQHGDDERLIAWWALLKQEYQLLTAEMAAVHADEKLDPQQKREIFHRLMKAFGEKLRP